MGQIFRTIAAVLAFALLGNAQTQAASDIGVNEKLGASVAMDVVLKDESGNDITLRQLIDKPTILVFIYFRCPGLCPLILNGMVEALNRIPEEPGKDFRVIAVSFDPTDTPEMARQKKANYLNQMKRRFNPDAWRFLTGSEQSTKAVADSAGFHFRRQKDMYVHPGAIMVLTPKGILSRYIYGTSFLPADVSMAIREAAGGQVRPTISKVLSFCYSYDPEGRQYVFSVTRLMGAVILVLVAIFIIFVLVGKSRKKQGT
jgi:protein SCO1/2